MKCTLDKNKLELGEREQEIINRLNENSRLERELLVARKHIEGLRKEFEVLEQQALREMKTTQARAEPYPKKLQRSKACQTVSLAKEDEYSQTEVNFIDCTDTPERLNSAEHIKSEQNSARFIGVGNWPRIPSLKNSEDNLKGLHCFENSSEVAQPKEIGIKRIQPKPLTSSSLRSEEKSRNISSKPGKRILKERQSSNLGEEQENTMHRANKINLTEVRRKKLSLSMDKPRSEEEESKPLAITKPRDAEEIDKRLESFKSRYTRYLSQWLTEFDSLKFVEQSDLVQVLAVEAGFKLQKEKLIRNLNFLDFFISLQSSQSSSCSEQVKPSESNVSRPADRKQMSMRLIKQFNNLPEQHLLMWGDSKYGKVGAASQSEVSLPTYFPGHQFKKMALGVSFSTGVDGKGQVYAWGKGDYLGFDGPDRSKPKLLRCLSGKLIVNITCGANHTVCSSSDGEVYTWVGPWLTQGSDEYGQLGQGMLKDQSSPKIVAKLMNKFAVKVFSGQYCSAAITGILTC